MSTENCEDDDIVILLVETLYIVMPAMDFNTTFECKRAAAESGVVE